MITRAKKTRGRKGKQGCTPTTATPNSISRSHILYKHPATFETLAMEPEKKQEIIEDLLTFGKSKDYYARTGKACKRYDL